MNASEFVVAEVGLARQLGVDRGILRSWREKELLKGRDWDQVGKSVQLTSAAAQKMASLAGVAWPPKNAPENALQAAPVAEDANTPPAPQSSILDSPASGNEPNFAAPPRTEKKIGGEAPALPPSAAEAEQPVKAPRPTSATVASKEGAAPGPAGPAAPPAAVPALPAPENMRITRATFKNTRIIEARRLDGGLPVMVRVKSAENFLPGMQIPVRREEDHWVLARACPRFRGKW